MARAIAYFALDARALLPVKPATRALPPDVPKWPIISANGANATLAIVPCVILDHVAAENKIDALRALTSMPAMFCLLKSAPLKAMLLS